MSKKSEPNTSTPALTKKSKKGNITEYLLEKNGLCVLFVPRPGTGVITSDIVYRVGSRDEARGETGLAHMLEHMLFKPTRFDIKKGQDSSAMQFERETGIILNANTWKDRTTYYFSYPKEHFEQALRIEAERMHDVVLTDESFKPEQGNVLSEFDMYAGDELFTLSVEMYGAAFHSHTYGHETIGYREDIAAYTIDKLRAFYETYYSPSNATLIVVGDVTEEEMMRVVDRYFGKLKSTPLPKKLILTEPKQEGVRTVSVKKQSIKQILGVGIKHEPFPGKAWFETMAIFDMLAGGQDSVLNKKFVDMGKVSNITTSFEESREQNLGIFFFTLTEKTTHEKMLAEFRKTVGELDVAHIAPYLKKTIAKLLMSECLTRENSLSFAAELAEYASAGVWEQFYDSEKILTGITPQSVKKRMDAMFVDENSTIGYFIGIK